jgi:hypothetical protein
MRTVLIGSDFMYDKDGNLKPIEINTNVGFSQLLMSDSNDIFNTTHLIEFVTQNGITKIDFIGNGGFSNILNSMSIDLGIEYEYHPQPANSITIPYIEDNETTLIIRSSYDTTALVDDTYCRDKVNFLNLIKDSSFGSQFAYKDDNGNLVNHITTIGDNGVHPNFILKARHPQYDKGVFPKLFRVSNQLELDVILENFTHEYFVMQYYYNPLKNINNKVTKIRSLNILYPPTLQSIPFGKYTDTTTQKLSETPEYDETTFELVSHLRNSYITAPGLSFDEPKLLDTDLVQMVDGTFKTSLDLQVGDVVRTIDIPNAINVDSTEETVNYKIDLGTFISGSTYSSNTIIKKQRVDTTTSMIEILFTDNSTWEDTELSYYLVEREDEVRFISLNALISGDIVILIDTTNPSSVGIVEKIVQSTTLISKEFGGWVITVERRHIFLTVTNSSTENISFAAIEHNNASCFEKWTRFDCGSGGCPPGQFCDGTVCSMCIMTPE